MEKVQMNPLAIVALKLEIERFREACEIAAADLSIDDPDHPFCDFPKGKCLMAAYLVGDYLHQQLDIPLNRIQIAINSWRNGSHAWTMLDEIIIDITADQFDDCSEQVIVSRKSAWHRTWSQPEFEEPELLAGNDFTDPMWSILYQHILRRMS
jgi:hypothetical protein